MGQSKDILQEFELESSEKQKLREKRRERQKKREETEARDKELQTIENNGVVASIGQEMRDELLRVSMDIFSEQARISSDTDEISSEKLQLSRARADNLLASVSGVIEMSNKIELLQAEQYKFKRHDELRLLNNLRIQYEKSAKFSDMVMNTCLEKMEDLQDAIMSSPDGIDDELLLEMGALSNMMDNAVVSLRNISKGSTELLKAERETGGRSYGDMSGNGSGNVHNNLYLNSLKGSKAEEAKNKAEKIRDNYKGEIRELTTQELLALSDE